MRVAGSNAGTLLVGDWSVFAQSLSIVANIGEHNERSLVTERAARRMIEERVKESAERYAIVVHGACDGLCELEVRSGLTDLAPDGRRCLVFATTESPIRATAGKVDCIRTAGKR